MIHNHNVSLDSNDLDVLLYVLMGLCSSGVYVEGKPSCGREIPIVIRYNEIKRLYERLLSQVSSRLLPNT